MLTPRPIVLTAIPIAWTPSTNGTISAPVFVAPMSKERDFAKWRGKLKGKIVLVTLPEHRQRAERTRRSSATPPRNWPSSTSISSRPTIRKPPTAG